MKKVSLYLTLSLIAISFVLGIFIGYFQTPEYKGNMYSKNMDLGFPDRTFDLRYINAMIAHHRGAILLAEQLKQNTEREDLKKLAEEILSNEPALINELYSWKKEWYGDVRQVREPKVSNLGSYDEKFDLRFLNAMIAHHVEGAAMAKETLSKSSRKEVVNNANVVYEFLTNGAQSLKTLRNSWYNI